MFHAQALSGSATALAEHLDAAITRGSVSASVEHRETLSIDGASMILRTYERYSFTGSNRLTLAVSILAVGDQMRIAMTTSGGSEAMFFKINTFGEQAFMDKAIEAVEAFTRT